MIKLTPILLAIAIAVIMYRFSAWRLKRELDEKSTRLADPVLLRQTAKLAEVLGLDKIPVHVYEVDPVNGLAAPDGRVFITRGFLRKYSTGEVSAAEITSVIAHELGHVALGHSKRRMIDFSAQNAIRVALGFVLNRIIPGLGGYLANFAASLLSARLSRQDEYEADAYAAALMSRAGLGIAPQVSLFHKLDTMAGGGAGMPAWLMSHPKSKDRIAAIEKLDAAWVSET